MNVLSLFDGMSCGQIALDQLGYDVDTYYAAEIDKYAIQVTQKNYPDTIQLGSVTEWRSWDIDWSSIDLVSGGFPCQAWSVAGKQLGDRDERGKLFWVMLDIMQNVLFFNPNAKFLMENVKMKSEFESYITHHTQEALGHVNKILINSALVSAQSRQRYYWTNIEGIEQPEDRGIVLKDILQDIVSDEYSSGEQILGGEHSNMLNTNYKSQANTIHDINKKAKTICAGTHGYALGHIKTGPCELREYRKTALCHQAATALDLEGHDINKRVYKDTGKSPTLNTVTKPNILMTDVQYRKLTPLECERLQTVPDNFSEVSQTKEYSLYNNKETNKKELLCNVNIMDVKLRQQLTSMESYALNITRDLIDTEQLNLLKKQVIKKRNVSIVIEKLAKKEVEQEGCVIDITKTGIDTEMLYIQIKSEILKAHEDTRKGLMVKLDTEKYMKIILEENSKEMRLFIILTLLKLIIELKIFTYVMDRANIYFCIDNLSLLQDNSLNLELSSLKMESIRLMSNTQRYKMLGNGWTVEVIKHIYKNIPHT